MYTIKNQDEIISDFRETDEYVKAVRKSKELDLLGVQISSMAQQPVT